MNENANADGLSTPAVPITTPSTIPTCQTPSFHPLASATLGSAEHPHVEMVRVLRCDTMPGFFICETLTTGSALRIHSQKLSLIWQNPN